MDYGNPDIDPDDVVFGEISFKDLDKLDSDLVINTSPLDRFYGKDFLKYRSLEFETGIDYGNTSFLITGDAEDWSEYMMIDAGVDLKADVLKVAHHGSRFSSTMEFLHEVNPQYAVISVGKSNTSGHPHEELLERLKEIGAKVLRTDELGTIVMKSDGETIQYAVH